MVRSIGAAFLRLNFNQHLNISVAIRLAFLAYGQWQDGWSDVKYTDVDYRVVTDAARHVLNGQSPYARHTFRYTPLLAYLMLPNLLWHPAVGKLLFVACDLLVAVLIKWLVELEYGQTLRALIRCNIRARGARASGRFALDDPDDTRGLPTQLPRKYTDAALWSACAWLYNPFTAVIATRGNGDALTGALVLATLYVLLCRERGTFVQHVAAGILHGLAVHVRLFPVVFSLSYYVFAGRERTGGFAARWLRPTRQQCGLVVGTMGTLAALTALFYALYGYEFVHETYLYHVIRKDTRHNFSLFFYQQYLQAGWPSVPALQSLLTVAPVLLIVLVVSLQWSARRQLLPMAVFLHTFAVVTFNTVLTSQYFVWYMAVAPVCLANCRGRWRWRATLAFAAVWLLTQALWLLTAYLLEFKGWNTFHLVWLHGAVFFGANVALMLRLVRNFALKPM